MSLSEMLITEVSAQAIADIMQSFYDEPGNRYFRLYYTDVRGQNRQWLWVRPRSDQEPFSIADGNQLINCVSEGGDEITIFVPTEDREYVPAEVRLARRT